MSRNDKIISLAKSTDRMLEDVAFLKDRERKERIEKHIFDLTNRYDADDSYAFYIAYCIGYSWFWLIGITNEARSKSIKWLKESLKLRSESNSFAKYYLGVIYFENNEYIEAKKVLDNIPEKVFSEIEQKWRDVNVRTMKACTNALIDSPNYEELNAISEVFTNDITCDFDLPIQIVNTCIRLWERGRKTDALTIFTKNVLKMLEQEQYEDAFSLEQKVLADLLDRH